MNIYDVNTHDQNDERIGSMGIGFGRPGFGLGGFGRPGFGFGGFGLPFFTGLATGAVLSPGWSYPVYQPYSMYQPYIY